MVQRVDVLEAQRILIRTREGSITAHFRVLDNVGAQVLVLLEPYKPFAVGTVFVPNRELTRISPNKATHMAYDGEYEAFRGGRHTVRRGGALPKSRDGEVQGLQHDVQTARSYVHILLSSGLLTEGEEALVMQAQRALIHDLRSKRNEHKLTACEQFVRGLERRDALGRNNPMAAGFVTGAAIGHLLGRTEDVRCIGMRVDRRTIAVYSDIDRHMQLYRELREALKPAPLRAQHGPHKAGFRFQNPIDRLELLLDPARGPRAMEASARRLQGFTQAFAAVKALPFRKNAEHTRLDLMDAVALAQAGNRLELRRQYARLRRGITWVYAQYALECEVIAPLSFLMEELRRVERARLRRAHVMAKTIQVTRSMAPGAFDRLDKAFAGFMDKLGECSDEGLRDPVKARLQGLLTQAQAAAVQDDWAEAKRLLKVASALL